MFLGIFLVLVTSYLKDHKYKPDYRIINSDEDNFCAEYPDGCIYIGDDDYLDSISTNEGDVLVEDLRIGNDPDMCIHDSYKIKDKDDRNDILEVICLYEEMYPTEWDRSIESMRLEWFMHNLGHEFDYKKDHSDDVDLDNDDEEKYDNKVLRKLFRL